MNVPVFLFFLGQTLQPPLCRLYSTRLHCCLVSFRGEWTYPARCFRPVERPTPSANAPPPVNRYMITHTYTHTQIHAPSHTGSMAKIKHISSLLVLLSCPAFLSLSLFFSLTFCSVFSSVHSSSLLSSPLLSSVGSGDDRKAVGPAGLRGMGQQAVVYGRLAGQGTLSPAVHGGLVLFQCSERRPGPPLLPQHPQSA